MKRARNPRGTVLVVDDEPPNLQYANRVLHSEFRCLTASSADEALQILQDHAVDIIVTDMRMPGKSGADLLAVARRTNPQACRLILSAFSEPRDLLAAANEGGAHRYLSKPITPKELREAVHNALESMRAQREQRAAGRRAAAERAAAQQGARVADDVEMSQLLDAYVTRARRFLGKLSVGVLRLDAAAADADRVRRLASGLSRLALVGPVGEAELAVLWPGLAREEAEGDLLRAIERARPWTSAEAAVVGVPEDGSDRAGLLARARERMRALEL